MEFLNILFVVLLFLTFRKKRNGDAFSLQTMNVMKGISIAGVFIGHASKEFGGIFLYKFLCYIGLWSVSIFFFVSGYGLMYMATHHTNYRNGYLKKRLMPIIICYLIVCLAQIAIDGELVNDIVKRILLCEYIPFSWYIFSITWLYLFFYVILILVSPSHHRVLFLLCLTGALAIYIIICQWLTGSNKGGVQMFSFIVGCIVASSEKIRIKCLRRESFAFVICVFLFLYAIQLTNKYVHYPQAFVYAYEPLVSYTFPIFVLGMMARRHSCPPLLEKLWLFLQRHSLQIYLIHGVVLYTMIEMMDLPSELLAFGILIISIGAAFSLRTIVSLIIKKI